MLARSGFLGSGSASSAFQHNAKTSTATSSSLPKSIKSTRNLTMNRSPYAGRLEPMGRSSLQPTIKEGAISALVISSTPSTMHNHKKPILTPSQKRWKAFRNLCRTTFEFMSNLGIGAIVIAYTIFGAFIFQAIELSHMDMEHRYSSTNPTSAKLEKVSSMPEKVVSLRLSTLNEVWKLTETHNIFNRSLWTIDVATALFHHQQDMVGLIRQGYEEQTLEEKWSFPAALMFTLRLVILYMQAKHIRIPSNILQFSKFFSSHILNHLLNLSILQNYQKFYVI